MGGEQGNGVGAALQDMELMILACKAKGGYRYRERLRLSEKELEELLAACETRLRMLAVSSHVAQVMLREPPPSYHPRWEEYQGRVADAVKELQQRKKPKAEVSA